MSDIRTFHVRMTNPGYFCSEFTVERIDGPLPITPKIGDVLAANELLNCVVNGSRVVIDPKITLETWQQCHWRIRDGEHWRACSLEAAHVAINVPHAPSAKYAGVSGVWEEGPEIPPVSAK